MKILLDAWVPRQLRNFLNDHTVKNAQESGWGKLQNGALLQAAEPEFDALITSDQKSQIPTEHRRAKTGHSRSTDQRLANPPATQRGDRNQSERA